MIITLFLLAAAVEAACPTAEVDYTVTFSTNGDFEDPVIPSGQDYIEGPNVKIAGWDSDIMQLGRGTKFNSLWGNTQVIEMDTTKNENYTKVETLTAGTYMLSFQYAARESKAVSTSGLAVHWNGQVIFSIISTDKLVHTENIFVTAVEGANTLILEGTAASDKYGMSVDNVNIYQVNTYNRDLDSASSSCDCKYGYFDNGINITCILCASVSPECEHCNYEYGNNTNLTAFNSSFFTCVDCPDGKFSDGALCQDCTMFLEDCTNCSIDGLECFDCQNNSFLYDVAADTLGLATNLTVNTSIFNKSVCVECPVDHCLLCHSLTECTLCN